MRLRNQLTLTLLIQSVGGCSTLLAALWIGTSLGPAQQGQFNQLKSLIDLGIALAAMGMPQALYIYVQSGRISVGQAWRISIAVGGMGLLTGATVTLWGMGVNLTLLTIVGTTVVAGCLHAQWRALVLLSPQTMLFNLVTVTPQLLLLPLAAWMVVSGQVSLLALSCAMFLVWVTASISAGLVVAKLPTQTGVRLAPPLRGLFAHGLSTGLTAVFAVLASVLLQKAAQQSTGNAGLGLISMALLLAQIPLTPLNYALPLLLKNRMTQVQTSKYQRKAVLISILLMVILAGVIWFLGNIRSDLWLGPAYFGLHVLLTMLLISNAAEVSLRLGGIEAQATLKPWKIAVAEAIRICTLTGLWFATIDEKSVYTLPQLAAGWVMASIMAVLALKVCNYFSQRNDTPKNPASLTP